MCARISGSSKPQQARPAEDVSLGLDYLRARLRNATLDVVWRQWRMLGAGAAMGSGDDDHAPQALIDPEALLLVSLALLPEERRLADLLHDWGSRNSDLLSVQRVKNLVAAYPAEVHEHLLEHLSWFATVARDEGKDLRWQSVAAMRPERDPSATLPRTRKGKVRATRARLTDDAAIMLRLRLAFGVGVKADLLTYLLARVHELVTVREINEATAYTPAAVRRAAEDLAAARLIETLEGQPASYRVTLKSWSTLLGLEERPLRWASWQDRFIFVAAFLRWVDVVSARPLTAYALGAQGRDFLERYRSALERDLVVTWSTHTKIESWQEFLGQAVHELADWMEEMA